MERESLRNITFFVILIMFTSYLSVQWVIACLRVWRFCSFVVFLCKNINHGIFGKALFMLRLLCRRFHFEFLLHFFCQFGSIWIFISRSVCHSCFNQTFWHFYDISFHNLHSKTYFLAELNNWQYELFALVRKPTM